MALPPSERPDLPAAETGTIRKSWKDRLRVALVYPNRYDVGMSNLGFQTVYRLINGLAHVVCERVFLPEPGQYADRQPVSVESRKALSEFDLIAFSISFEIDYANMLAILGRTGLPLYNDDRGAPHPLVVAGGVTCFLNPEPVAPFLDAIMVGEAEAILPSFFKHYDPGREREPHLAELARIIPGLYIPALYRPRYAADGTLAGHTLTADVPPSIQRAVVGDLSAAPPTESAIITPHTTFDSTHLIEVSRGCPHGCRFCSAGYAYRPIRYRPLEMLEAGLHRGAAVCSKIGLVGAAVSDHPELAAFCRTAIQNDIELSFSSLRADALNQQLIARLHETRVKTATIAPDAGSERMRRVINKGLDRQTILDAVHTLTAGGIPNLKLYFMVGLPFEEEADIDAICDLTREIKAVFLAASRPLGRMGTITLSINPFIPKPVTPFQWCAMVPVADLKRRIARIRKSLGRVPNVVVQSESPRSAHVQALLSRGDRRLASVIEAAGAGKGWPAAVKRLVPPPAFHVQRQRPFDEVLPWDLIDNRVSKSFLVAEYHRASRARPTPACNPSNCTLCGACKP